MIRRITLPIIVLSLMMAGGCATNPLRYKIDTNQEMLDWAAHFDGNTLVTFEPAGIWAEGGNLFIYGSFTVPAFVVRSFVLVSEDGGVTWREAAQPVPGAEVFSLLFTESETGYVLFTRFDDTRVELFLQKSVDGGLTWKVLPSPPTGEYMGMPDSFGFKNGQEGHILLEYLDQDPMDVRPELVTKDGGMTWSKYDHENMRIMMAKRKSNYVTTMDTEKFQFVREGTFWNLYKMTLDNQNAEPVFSFDSDVSIDRVIGIKLEDCGCSKPEIKKRNRDMLK